MYKRQGVAPKEDRRSSFYQGQDWCGNVDIGDITEGTTVILPVHVEGAMFSIGDIHALQGDGEITGCALECQGIVEVRISVISSCLLYTSKRYSGKTSSKAQVHESTDSNTSQNQ